MSGSTRSRTNFIPKNFRWIFRFCDETEALQTTTVDEGELELDRRHFVWRYMQLKQLKWKILSNNSCCTLFVPLVVARMYRMSSGTVVIVFSPDLLAFWSLSCCCCCFSLSASGLAESASTAIESASPSSSHSNMVTEKGYLKKNFLGDRLL